MYESNPSLKKNLISNTVYHAEVTAEKLPKYYYHIDDCAPSFLKLESFPNYLLIVFLFTAISKKVVIVRGFKKLKLSKSWKLKRSFSQIFKFIAQKGPISCILKATKNCSVLSQFNFTNE